MAKKESIKIPFNKTDFAVAELLSKKHFLKGAARKGKGIKKIIEVQLNYEDKIGAIRGVKFLSKPSRRLYVGYKEIKPVKHGFGIVVLSTSKGIMTGSEARREKAGGEILFEVW